MEAIGALFTTVIGGAKAAAGAITGLAGAGGGAAAGGSSLLTALQGAGTVFSALSSYGAGRAQRAEMEAQAEQQQFEARQEYITGKETSAALKAELASTVANQAVAFAAGGVDLSSVSVGAARRQAVQDAEAELSVSSNQTLSRSLARQRAARNYRLRGRNAQSAGLTQAIGTGLDFAIDVAGRGYGQEAG